jgi:hypothetical protein
VVDETRDSVSSSEEAEIDLSDWEDSVTVEGDEPATVAETEVAEIGADQELPGAAAIEIIDEMRFYLSHGMPDQARAVLPKLQALTHDDRLIAKLREEIEAAAKPPASAKSSKAKDAADLGQARDKVLKKPEPVAIPEFTIEDSSVEEIAAEDIPSAEFTVDQDDEPGFATLPVVAEQPSPAAELHATALPPEDLPVEEVPFEELPVAEAPVAVEAPAPTPELPVATPAASLNEFVADLESSLGEIAPVAAAIPATDQSPLETASTIQAPAAATAPAEVDIPVPAPVASTPEPVVPAEAPAASVQPAPIIGDLVADLEASLGDDFLKSAPLPPEAMPAPAAVAAAPPQVTTPPLAASAAASASATNVAPPHSAPTPAVPVASAHISIPTPPPAPVPSPPVATISAFSEETAVDLNDMFGELKQDLESGASTTEEDPETHYNLGVAFREMGLLDEAIGELQKTCQSIDHGRPFSQTMQAYTWLAQCFLDKGVPEAAARWYDKALNVPGIDGETRTALHYELGSAFETAGDRLSALKHFMNVYGSNIDYRDVAERIKALKS